MERLFAGQSIVFEDLDIVAGYARKRLQVVWSRVAEIIPEVEIANSPCVSEASPVSSRSYLAVEKFGVFEPVYAKASWAISPPAGKRRWGVTDCRGPLASPPKGQKVDPEPLLTRVAQVCCTPRECVSLGALPCS